MKKIIYIIIVIIVLTLFVFIVYKNYNYKNSYINKNNFFDFKKIEHLVSQHAFDNEILSDMTAISFPIPLPPNDWKFPIAFMLYYSIPSEIGGHINPDINMPYAYIVVDTKKEEIISYEQKEISDSRVPARFIAKITESMDREMKKYIFNREIYEELIPYIFYLYWENITLSKKDIEAIYKYIEINSLILEDSLAEEYHKINPDFFEWLDNKKNVSVSTV